MQAINPADAKRLIIERLEQLSADELQSVLIYIQFASLNPASRNLLSALYDEEPLNDHAKALIQEAMNEPGPGIPDEEIRKELGL